MDGGRGDLLRLRGLLRQLLQQDDLGAAVLAVFFRHGLKLLDDLPADVLFQLLRLGGAPQNIFLVDVPQAQVSNVFGLNFIQAKALHQVGHDQVVLLGVADDGDGLVDVQQDGT